MAYLLGIIFLLTPAYVWRFGILGLPLNFLIVAIAIFWVVFAIWLIRRHHIDAFLKSIIDVDKKLLIPVALFAIAGLVALFVGGVDHAKIGQFVVLFVQPISIFFIARFIVSQDKSSGDTFIYAVYVFLAIVGVLALVQYFTRVTLPPEWWGNTEEPKRAIGFFVHPNGLGLFLAPILAWLMPDVGQRLNEWRQLRSTLLLLAWLLGVVALFLSLSRGAWFGLAAAGIAFVVLSANKKYLITAGVVGIIAALVIVATPNLRYRLILPFKGEKSSVARLSLWHTGEKMLADSPILGKGLNGFDNNWDKYNTDPNLQHYNFAHNILLNFWIDTGLLGLLSMGLVMLYSLVEGIRGRNNRYKLAIALFMIAIIVHGLIDIPYFKNDLALVFWLILGLTF